MREYEQNEERYAQSLLAGMKIAGFYCSEYYGAHMSEALGCRDVRVDEGRNTIPVSATMIRQDAYRYREFVDPLVYRDLVIKVVFVGAMSTGKSTLTEALASRYNTAYASEYGRDYWAEHQRNRRIELDEFDAIVDGHITREDAAIQNANKYFFVDTNAITTYMYSLDYCGRATEHLTRTALENAARYDLFFLCMDDIPYDDTWDRSGSAKRHIFQKQTIADIKMRRIPYIPLRGDLETRIHRVSEVLKNYSPYDNYFGRLSS
jgi:NadR type nicotinamide-nucleotide adenylyltransferase